MSEPSKVRRAVSVLAGVSFLLAGGFKPFIPLIKPGASFAGFLAQVGVPYPELAMWVVIATEVLGGLALITGRFANAACVALAIDMVVAIVTVGIPGTFQGRPVVIGDEKVGAEPWRIPLEVALLAGCVFVGRLWRPWPPSRFLTPREKSS